MISSSFGGVSALVEQAALQNQSHQFEPEENCQREANSTRLDVPEQEEKGEKSRPRRRLRSP